MYNTPNTPLSVSRPLLSSPAISTPAKPVRHCPVLQFQSPPERRTCFETEWVMALQGHPRSLILAPIESAYATSYRSSIVTLILSCFVSEILQVSCWELLHPYSTRILGVFPLDYMPMLWLQGAKTLTYLFVVINFELVQPICPRYITSRTERQTDRRMDDLR